MNTIGCCAFTNINANACKDNIGGIKNAWVYSFSASSVTDDGTYITGITTGCSAVYQITPARASGSVTSSQPYDNTNTLWTTEASLMYMKNEATLRNFVLSLGKTEVVFIWEDRNGYYFAIGTEVGANVGTEYASGTAEADKNAWTLKFQALESVPPIPVSATLMATYTI